ncbi:hypothetical protein J2T57_004190 [Natronocella acetinitrilica]|jgi:hypothetical protein|uniref:DUF1475 domain-containing protein n=1 Tax=Natronocella acetinitrilica TaxID=414046 RepID=A0AAE3KDM2_9GAMM|nr:DUF1475 family protein [Natronocella acetinitrilica]MCP1677016.1 hypothetical protein [Natronocella acetinitrilica]
MIAGLRLFFAAVLVAMVAIILFASADRGIGEALADLGRDPWVQAALMDAYFGFLTIWLWMAYKEPTWLRRIGWLIAVLLTGNVAIAIYLLIQLFSLRPGDGIEALLLRRDRADAA